MLDRLAALFPGSSRRTRKQWLEEGRVQVNGAVVRRSDAAVRGADRIELGAPPPPPFPAALRRIHEDDDVLVVDKPPGILTIATERERERTVYRMLADYVGAQVTHGRRRRLFIVHRLDRETSGVLLFAKSGRSKRMLQEQFEARTVERLYVAIVEGRVRTPEGAIRSRLRSDRSLRIRSTRRRTEGKEAITQYRVREVRDTCTVLELSLTTGRRGQIRAQLSELGHPVVGDDAYGARNNPLRRLCLHATSLTVATPSARRTTFTSPLPASFARVP